MAMARALKSCASLTHTSIATPTTAANEIRMRRDYQRPGAAAFLTTSGGTPATPRSAEDTPDRRAVRQIEEHRHIHAEHRHHRPHHPADRQARTDARREQHAA